MLKRMGPFQNVLKLIPGMSKQLGDIDVDEKQLGARRGDRPLDDAARTLAAACHRRLAAPANRAPERHTVQQVNQLLDARKQMEKLMKQMGKGKMGMPDLASLQNGEAMQQQSQRPRPSATNEATRANGRRKRGDK